MKARQETSQPSPSRSGPLECAETEMEMSFWNIYQHVLCDNRIICIVRDVLKKIVITIGTWIPLDAHTLSWLQWWPGFYSNKILSLANKDYENNNNMYTYWSLILSITFGTIFILNKLYIGKESFHEIDISNINRIF